MLNYDQLSLAVVQRLVSGQDLRNGLEAIAGDERLDAATVASLVGSLARARLRLAGGDSVLSIEGPLEIVGATGTISASSLHIHLCVSDNSGALYGGHLLEGCIVDTTVEVVLLDLSAWWRFGREPDPCTGWAELKAERKVR